MRLVALYISFSLAAAMILLALAVLTVGSPEYCGTDGQQPRDHDLRLRWSRADARAPPQLGDRAGRGR